MKTPILLTLVLSVASVCLGAETQSQVNRDVAAARAVIANFHVVMRGQILRGAQPDENGIKALAKLHVATIIDLQGGDVQGQNVLYNLINSFIEPGESAQAIDDESKLAHANGIEFFNIPLNSHDEVTDAEAAKIDQIIELIHQRTGRSVFVHCQHGADRTGLIVALYQVRYNRLPPADAFAEMQANGHSGLMNYAVTHELDEYFWAMAPRYAALAKLP